MANLRCLLSTPTNLLRPSAILSIVRPQLPNSANRFIQYVAAHALLPTNPNRVAPDPGDDTLFWRFLQRRSLYLSSSASSAMQEMLRLRGENLLEKLREMDISRDQIRLDGLRPPTPVSEARSSEREFSVADAKKILRVSQIDMLKSKLRSSDKNHISYDEFVEICVEGCSNREQGLDLAKALDDSGSVIVLGNDLMTLKLFRRVVDESVGRVWELRSDDGEDGGGT